MVKSNIQVVLLDEHGELVFRPWFTALPLAHRMKWRARIELLEQHGVKLGVPFVESVCEDVYALTCSHENSLNRILFFVGGDSLVLSFPSEGPVVSQFEIKRLKKARERFIASAQNRAKGGPNDVT